MGIITSKRSGTATVHGSGFANTGNMTFTNYVGGDGCEANKPSGFFNRGFPISGASISSKKNKNKTGSNSNSNMIIQVLKISKSPLRIAINGVSYIIKKMVERCSNKNTFYVDQDYTQPIIFSSGTEINIQILDTVHGELHVMHCDDVTIAKSVDAVTISHCDSVSIGGDILKDVKVAHIDKMKVAQNVYGSIEVEHGDLSVGSIDSLSNVSVTFGDLKVKSAPGEFFDKGGHNKEPNTTDHGSDTQFQSKSQSKPTQSGIHDKKKPKKHTKKSSRSPSRQCGINQKSIQIRRISDLL